MLRNLVQRPFFIYFLQIVGIALAYFIAGKLGNLLVIPPNYATVVFPSSGVALAGVLLYGKRVGFGILLGAFLFNGSIIITTSDLSESLNSALITLVIAGGATLQAFVGAYLIQRFAATPNFLSCKKKYPVIFLFWRICQRVNKFDTFHFIIGRHWANVRRHFFLKLDVLVER